MKKFYARNYQTSTILPTEFTIITTTNTISGAEFVILTPGQSVTIQIGLS